MIFLSFSGVNLIAGAGFTKTLTPLSKQKSIILALIDNYKNINSWIKVSTLKEITNINSASIKSLIDKEILNEKKNRKYSYKKPA